MNYKIILYSAVSLSLAAFMQGCSHAKEAKFLTTYITSWSGYENDPTKQYPIYAVHGSYPSEYQNRTPIDNPDMLIKANKSDVIAYAFLQVWNPSFESARGRSVPADWAGHLHSLDLWGDFSNLKVDDANKFNSFCVSTSHGNKISPECAAFNMGGELRQYLSPKNSDPYGEGQLDSFGAFTKLPTHAKKIISIGGANTPANKAISTATFDSIFANQEVFLNSLALWVQNPEFHLSGIDYDLEPPIDTNSGAQLPADQTQISDKYGNLFKLVQGTREKLGKDAYVAVTITVNKSYLEMINNAPAENGETGAWFKDISKYVDAVNIMTYDMHGPWDKSADPGAISHAMLAKPDASIVDMSKYAINYTTDEIIDLVVQNYQADPSKLQVGIATYGRGFSGVQPGVNASYPGFSQSWIGTAIFDSKYTNSEIGLLPYKSILALMKDDLSYKSYEVKNGDDVVASYMYSSSANSGQLVGYETPAMMDATCHLLNEKNIKGAILWSMDTDTASSANTDSSSLIDRYDRVCR